MADKSRTTKPEWILLIHQLPPKPTNLRVRIWRKLQKLGAVAIKNSVDVAKVALGAITGGVLFAVAKGTLCQLGTQDEE